MTSERAMDEALSHFKYQIFGVLRFRRLAVVTAWLALLIGMTVIYTLPDQYEARARVYIDTQSVLRPLLKGIAVETDVATELHMMARAILGANHLERVIRETDLALLATNERAKQRLIRELAKKIRIESSGGPGRGPDNLYVIRYGNSDPKIAAAVVEKLLDTLIESSIGSKRRDAVNAERFLSRQVKEYESRLAEAEKRLAKFKQENIGLMPSDGRDYYSRLQAAMDALKRTRIELRIAEDRRREIGKQAAGAVGEDQGASQSLWTAGVDKEIEARQADLNAKLLVYTDRHPDVIALKEMIEQLKARKQQQLAKLEKGVTSARLPDSPVFDGMKIALNEIELEMAGLRTREGELSQEVRELRAHIDTMPQIEARLADLNRDYAVTKQQYESLLQRLEAARLSQGAGGTPYSLRIIDPPVVPLSPEGPRRGLYLLVLPFVSIGLGVGVAFVVHQLRPAFSDRDELREAIGLPVLGSVSVIYNAATRRATRAATRAYVAAVILLLITGFATAWVTSEGSGAASNGTEDREGSQ